MTGIIYAAVLPDPGRAVSECVNQDYAEYELTRLRNGHNIVALKHSWNSIGLNGSWLIVLGELDVAHHYWVKTSIVKLHHCQ